MLRMLVIAASALLTSGCAAAIPAGAPGGPVCVPPPAIVTPHEAAPGDIVTVIGADAGWATVVIGGIDYVGECNDTGGLHLLRSCASLWPTVEIVAH